MQRLTKLAAAFCVPGILCATLVLTAAARAQNVAPAPPTVDPHAVYEKSCNGCHHEHGADLARLKMKLVGQRVLVNRTGKDVTALLRNHHGVKLAEPDAAALVSLFRNGITWGGVFQARCAQCHGRAASFAREKLSLDGGTLKSRASGKDVGAFLGSHGNATPDEIAVLLEMLKWQLATVPAR